MITLLSAGVRTFEHQMRHLTTGELSDVKQCVADTDSTYAVQKVHTADQRRALTGRAALRLVTAAHMGAEWHQAGLLPIRRICRHCPADHGKPSLEGVALSSSSSHDVVLAGAAADGEEIGVDIEAIPSTLFMGFDAYTLHPQEATLRGTVGGVGDRPEVYGDHAEGIAVRIERWVMKEALLKAAGLGLDHPPHQLWVGKPFRTTTWYGHRGRRTLRWRPVRQAADSALENLWCCLIPAFPGYRAAVAARVPEDIEEIH